MNTGALTFIFELDELLLPLLFTSIVSCSTGEGVLGPEFGPENDELLLLLVELLPAPLLLLSCV